MFTVLKMEVLKNLKSLFSGCTNQVFSREHLLHVLRVGKQRCVFRGGNLPHRSLVRKRSVLNTALCSSFKMITFNNTPVLH